MNDREKLIELVVQKQDCGLTHNAMGRDYVTYNADIADHLIANGVTFAKDKNVPGNSNGDRIRSMRDDELASFLESITYARATPWSEPFKRQFCDNCPTEEVEITETGQKMSLHVCDFADGVCPHGDSVAWWLKQPANTGTDTNVGSK